MRVPQRVVQRLLGDIIQFFLDARRQGVPFAGGQKTGLDTHPLFDGIQALLECTHQSDLLEHGRTQLKEQEAHFLERLFALLRDLLKVNGGVRRVKPPLFRHHPPTACQKHRAVEGLNHRIVQLARQAVSLLLHGNRLCLLIEPHVLNRRRNFAGDGLGEIDFFGAERAFGLNAVDRHDADDVAVDTQRYQQERAGSQCLQQVVHPREQRTGLRGGDDQRFVLIYHLSKDGHVVEIKRTLAARFGQQ